MPLDKKLSQFSPLHILIYNKKTVYLPIGDSCIKLIQQTVHRRSHPRLMATWSCSHHCSRGTIYNTYIYIKRKNDLQLRTFNNSFKVSRITFKGWMPPMQNTWSVTFLSQFNLIHFTQTRLPKAYFNMIVPTSSWQFQAVTFQKTSTSKYCTYRFLPISAVHLTLKIIFQI
jgi:hypothetical protein